MVVICGGGGRGGGGEKHKLLRNDHVLCAYGSSLHTLSSLLTIYGLTNDTALLTKH